MVNAQATEVHQRRAEVEMVNVKSTAVLPERLEAAQEDSQSSFFLPVEGGVVGIIHPEVTGHQDLRIESQLLFSLSQPPSHAADHRG